MFIVLARLFLAATCLYLLPNAILDSQSLPTPTSASTNKKDWRLTLARLLFAWTFTECSVLFLLLVLQATDSLSASTRAANFQFSLYALLAIHTVLIPQSIALLVFSPGSSVAALLRSPRTILLSFVPVAISLALLSYIPLYHPSPTLLSRTLSRLIVLGTSILGLLSGFGAVTRAWHFLPSSAKKDIVPTEQDIRTTETSIQSVQADLERKQARRTPVTPSSWVKRVGDTFRGGDDLTLEIKGLQTLHDTLTLTLQSQRAKLASSKYSRTLHGRLSSFLGRIFAGYCVFRIFTAGYNIAFLSRYQSNPQIQVQQRTYPDILTNLLIWLLVPSTPNTDPSSTLKLTPESISSLTRHISLLLIGLIVLSSIGLVMRGVNRALKVTSRTLGTSIILLLLAYLMGIYLLSTLVQLRSSFPPPHHTSLNEIPNLEEDATPSNLFSLVPPYELFNSLFDAAFLLSAVLTVVVNWSMERLSMIE